VTRQLPAVVELRLEAFQPTLAQRDTSHAAPGPPLLLLLLADGTLMAYKAFLGPEGGLLFARLSLPLLAARPRADTQRGRANLQQRITRFDRLGDGTGLLHRCASCSCRCLNVLIIAFKVPLNLSGHRPRF
jgi:hypothetical protein